MSKDEAIGHLVHAGTVVGSAGALSFLAAYCRARNITFTPFGVPLVKNGEMLGVPYSLAAAVISGGLAVLGWAPRSWKPHLVNVTVGGLTAYATTLAIKMGYKGTASPISLGAAPYNGELQSGYGYYGATPQMDALFSEAGI